MLNGISKYLKRNIFAYVGIIRTIQITKISKKYINELEIIEEINMNNFCKIYYQNDNKKPSLYILLRHFKSKLPKNIFIEIYTYYMNNYIKKNSDELIELDLLLDCDIVQTIINKNLLNTNKISLVITSLELSLNKNINFKNSKNIEQIYFNIVSPNQDIIRQMPKYAYNEIYNNYLFLVYYLLALKIFNNIIPENIKKLGLSHDYTFNDINQEKINLILKGLKIEENLTNIKILNLIFDELYKYKNIKSFRFNSDDDTSFSFLLDNNCEHKFIQNLDEIQIDFSIFNKEKDVTSFINLVDNKSIRNKLNISLEINIDQFEEIIKYVDIVKIKEIRISWIHQYKYKNKEININFQNKFKNLGFDMTLYDFKFFKQLSNLEELYIKFTNYDFDYTSFKHLVNLQKLEIFKLNLENDDALSNLFQTFNKYNQNLISIEINNFDLKKMLYGNEVKLSILLELKNLKNFSFRCLELLNGEEINTENGIVFSYLDYYKINNFNIDKCEKLENIRVPYYFECNNAKVLNNLKKISIDLLEPNNIKFLKLILNCNNLRDLFISFLLPFHNYDSINYLYENIGKVRGIECEIHFNIIKNNYVKEKSDINAKALTNFENEYMKQIKNIMKNKNEMNFIEDLYVLPKYEDYEDFRKLDYDEKISILENFPIIQIYGTISMEDQYLCKKINFSKEKELFLNYFGINKKNEY